MSSATNVVTTDGNFHAYMVEPKALPAPAVVVVQEAIGSTPRLRAACDELATYGFIGICPDLHWRQKPNAEKSTETDWTGPEILGQELDIDQAVADIKATVAHVRDLYWCTGNVGVMGFGFGGLLTYLTAVRGGVDAGVCYYGARMEEFLSESALLRGALLVHHGELDEFISPGAQTAIQNELASRGARIHRYAGCHHEFARSDSMHFDTQAASDASARTVAFFRNHLRG